MNRQVITVLYSQISVFSNGTPEFNAWEDAHVAQGMSWREGHVSFGVPEHEGPCLLEWGMYTTDSIKVSTAERVLTAPLVVETSGCGIATVLDEIETDIAGGGYQIWFAATPLEKTGAEKPDLFVQICFEKTNNADFNIVKPGAEMTARQVHLRQADIAG